MSNDNLMNSDKLSEIIIRQVLDGHGEIKDLREVRASNVFDNRWRIDIWCHYDSTQTIMKTVCAKIFYSYFIHVNESGNITKCSPPLGEKRVSSKTPRLG